MYHEFVSVWKELLSQGLKDDGWPWDFTTSGTLGARAERPIRAKIVAKAQGVWAAAAGLEALTEHSKGQIRTSTKIPEGSLVKKGAVVAEWRGPARLVLAYERPFLNLAQYACGIATRTRQLVEIVERACPKNTPRVVPTRKTLPGYRDLAIAAVLAGGGKPNRLSLSGGVLIKENHIAAAGGIEKAIEGARATAPHLLKIEIEVRDSRELARALKSRADVIMLDNFSPSEVKAALKSIERESFRPVIEVSGGINEASIASYAIPGVDVISCGSLTHSVEAMDLSLLAEGVK